MSEDLISRLVADRPYFMTVALRIARGNEHDAEDIVQQAYTNILKRNDLTDENPRGLMAFTMHNAAMSTYRHRQIMRRHEKTLDVSDAVYEPPVDPVPAEVSDALPRAMARLSPKQQALIQGFADGLPYNQIAEKLSLPIGSVMSGLYRARQKLQKELAQYVPAVQNTDVAA